MRMRLAIPLLVLSGLAASCGGDDDTGEAADTTTAEVTTSTASAPSSTAATSTTEAAETSGLRPGLNECDAVLTFEEFTSITGFAATECDGLGGFAGPDGSTIVQIYAFSSPAEAQARGTEEEEGLTEDEDRFTGAGWEAFEASGGAKAVAGRLFLVVRPSSQTGGPLDGLDQTEVRRITGLLFDAMVTKWGES